MHEFNLSHLEELLPDSVREIAAVIGFPATQALVERYGGVCFPIGRGMRGEGARRLTLLREVIGHENTQRLIQHFGGESSLVIPRCAAALREWRNRCFLAEVDALVDAGESVRMALTLTAPKYGIANTWAWELLSRRRHRSPPTSQGSLF